MSRKIDVLCDVQGRNELFLLMQAVEEQAAQRIRSAAKTIMMMAAEYTPKYSGTATRGWRITLDASKVQTHADYDPRHEPAPEQYDAPIYEGGMLDARAHSLNAQVANLQLGNLRDSFITKRLQAAPVIELHLYNAVPYSAIWLEDMPLAAKLREVNKDYWTMDELRQAIETRFASGVF